MMAARSRGGSEAELHSKWLFIASLFVTVCAADIKKQVVSSLEARWPHTSYVAETSEFLAKKGVEGFFDYVEKLIAHGTGNNSNAEQEYNSALQAAAPLLRGEAETGLLKFALSLRVYSPRVHAHQQIASDYAQASECDLFVDVNRHVTCSEKELDGLLSTADQPDSDGLAVYSIDHVHPLSRNESGKPIAILYASVDRPGAFQAFHHKLKGAVEEGRISLYIFRHFQRSPSIGEQSVSSSRKVGLSGYGIELAIKNTEYKAIDDSTTTKDMADGGGSESEEGADGAEDQHGFNFKRLKELHGHLRPSLQQFKVHLAEMEELSPLKQWEVADIGYQAAQRIIDAPPEEALATLIDISQNFPTRARSLVQTKVKKVFRDEVQANQKRFADELELGEGENALYVNGISVDVETLDAFQLFNTVRDEEALANAFFQMGFRREYLSILSNMDQSDNEKGAYALDYREAYPEYINDLDRDKHYKEWGNSVKLLLQPYFPGMMRPIARNLYTLIVMVDPAAKESWNLLKIAHTFFVHHVPLRIGFVFVVDDAKLGKEDTGVALLNLYNFAKIDRTPAKAVHLLIKLLDEQWGGGSDAGALEPEVVHKFFLKQFPDQSIDDVFAADSDYDGGKKAGSAFFRRSGFHSLPKVLLNGMALDESSLQADKIEEAILMQVMKQTPMLQRAVLGGKLTDRENVQNWMMSQPDVLPRLNSRLLHEPQVYVPLFDVNPCLAKSLHQFKTLREEQRAQCILEGAKYLAKGDDGDESATKWLSIWLVGDVDASPQARSLLANGLKALKKSGNLRLTMIHNGEPTSTTSPVKGISLAMLVQRIMRQQPSTIAKQMLHKLLASEDSAKQVQRSGSLEKIAVHGVDSDSLKKSLEGRNPDDTDLLQIHSHFSSQSLKLKAGQVAVVVNGYVYGPLEEGENFEMEDFLLLERIFERRGAKQVAVQIDEWGVTKENEKSSDVVLRSMAVIGAYATKKKRTFVDFGGEDSERWRFSIHPLRYPALHTPNFKFSVVNLISQDGSRPVIDILAVVDPLSRGAQKLASVIQILTNVVNSDLRMAVNPKERLSELPLKRFYRYVLQEEPLFDSRGRAVTPFASFQDLPSKQLLTLNVIAPDPWMYHSVYAEYDLDNIKMENVNKDVVARFELIHILLEGHCFDEVTGNPPRGLQYSLGTKSRPSRYDTIVMANLGYFQLKAGPGAWTLRLREGKSIEIYGIKSSVDTESNVATRNPSPDEQVDVLVDSFTGKTVRIRVAKRPGMEARNLLSDDGQGESQKGGGEEDEGENGGRAKSIWSSIKNTLSGGEKHEQINIFSLASGHLYERFMRIMLLSVMKNTKHRVKFWLLDNYLSPQFRESLPKLANKYGFEFELIQYKWPRWLHQQTEKQRVMWGYKILFLDVLFPLDVRKIIFVDADQVVRSDLMELMEVDLGGASYGYTPFCDSRQEMEGFRFWKRGYWATHLAGRRYHISALYVVDLVKFRQIAAGDRLRGQYQGLSSDPNSLSNLDQDLPNNMIHQVRIKSLPQEWLWCETWCDEGSKSTAKTIDLCNNPQTKEPKLDSAIRIIPEWASYDNEIKAVLAEEVHGPADTPEAKRKGEEGEEKEREEL